MTDEASAPVRQEAVKEIDRQLLAESKLYNVPYKAYLEMSKRERGAVKATWTRNLRHEAKRRGVDGDEFVVMSEEERERVRKEYPERPPPAKKARTVDDVITARVGQLAENVDEDLQRESDTFSRGSDVPATETDPDRRDRPTLGDVRPVGNDDLVGWEPPKNLLDIFSRYTIGDGQHFVRVERLEPRIYQQLPCSGYLGQIREPMTEEQFHSFYGGRIYELRVYGPDTRGRQDPVTGQPLIKPKTEPFRYTVPMFPPNLAALPGMNPKKNTGDPMHPFANIFAPNALPTTQADASMHKSNLDFLSHVVDRSNETTRELRRELQAKGGTDVEVLKVVSDQSSRAAEASQKAADAREERLLQQVQDERESRKELAAKLDRLQEQMATAPRESPMKDAAELLKVTNPGQNAEQQLARQNEAHRSEIASLKESHRDAIETLKSSHKDAMDTIKGRQEDELKQNRARTEDLERNYKQRLDDVEKRYRDREQEHRDAMDTMRRDERQLADQRVKDTEKRFEDRIADMKVQQERELRMQTEQHQTRIETTKSNLDLQISNLKEKSKRLEEDLAEARDEAAAAGNPVEVLEKQEKIAAALGYKKEDKDGPQTAGERFAATAGMGLGKALEDIGTWLPKAAEAFNRRQALGGPAVAPQGLPPGRPGPGQQRPVRGPGGPGARRAVAWSTQGSIPITDHRPNIPPEAPPITVQPSPEPAVAPAPEHPAAEPQQQHEPQQAPPDVSGVPDSPLLALFPPEVMVAFRGEVEMCIDAGMPAEEFAQRFVARFPDAARMLVTEFKPELLEQVVQGMPNGQNSNILRRDGKRWVEKLWNEIPIQLAKAASSGASAQAGTN